MMGYERVLSEEDAANRSGLHPDHSSSHSTLSSVRKKDFFLQKSASIRFFDASRYEATYDEPVLDCAGQVDVGSGPIGAPQDMSIGELCGDFLAHFEALYRYAGTNGAFDL